MQPIFGLNRWPSSVVVARTGVQYEFALADTRPVPPELVMPLFLALTSARELDDGLSDRSGTTRIYDPQTPLSWEIEVEGLGRVSVKRNPATSGPGGRGQSTMNSVAPFGADERWRSAPSATW